MLTAFDCRASGTIRLMREAYHGSGAAARPGDRMRADHPPRPSVESPSVLHVFELPLTTANHAVLHL